LTKIMTDEEATAIEETKSKAANSVWREWLSECS
jgi:hypothetical protein